MKSCVILGALVLKLLSKLSFSSILIKRIKKTCVFSSCSPCLSNESRICGTVCLSWVYVLVNFTFNCTNNETYYVHRLTFSNSRSWLKICCSWLCCMSFHFNWTASMNNKNNLNSSTFHWFLDILSSWKERQAHWSWYASKSCSILHGFVDSIANLWLWTLCGLWI